MSEKLNVKKGEFLDPSSNQLAVRMALAETNIIQETKQILQDVCAIDPESEWLS
jgi:hypothetical protein